MLRAEAFASALDAFCAGEDPARLRLLATYGAGGLPQDARGRRRDARAAGRPLVLELDVEADLETRIVELRPRRPRRSRSRRRRRRQGGSREQVAAALELLDDTPTADRLIDLSAVAVRGRGKERFAAYEAARCALEQTALNVLAGADRDLLQELLTGFGDAYQEAKDSESALDFEDLQLRARDLLAIPEVAERERLRFRTVMVDEFQDTTACSAS